MIDKTNAPSMFHGDGSLRDVYVLQTSDTEWDRFLEWLRTACASLVTTFLDGKPAPLPTTMAAIQSLREQASPLLSVNLSGLILNCHFFWEKDIELDLDPREMTQPRLDAFMKWIRELGALLERDVLVTEENTPSAPVLAYLRNIDRVVAVAATDTPPSP